MPPITSLERFPVLTTPRLLLDQPQFSDTAAFFEILSDAETAAALNVEQLIHMDAAAQIIKTWRNGFRRRESIRWAIRARGGKSLLGTAGFRNFSASEAELGFVLSPAARGQGIMKEALLKIISYGFSALGLQKVRAYVLRENTISCQLLRSLGFRTGKDLLNDELLICLYLLKEGEW